MNNRRMITVALGISVGLSACVTPSENETAEEAVEEAEFEIINGTPVVTNNRGVALLTTGTDSCTGTMLNHLWVLTAAHCIDVTNQSGTTVSLNGVVRTSQTIVKQKDWDVALIVLGTPMPINGQYSGYSLPIHWGDNNSLEGQALDCWGYGRNSYWGGFGTLRQASITVASTTDQFLTYEPNAAGQIQWRGDSGGTCFFTQSGVLRATGVNATGKHDGVGTVFSCDQVGPQVYREWLLGLPFNKGPALVADLDGNGKADLVFPWYAGSGAGLTIHSATLVTGASFTRRSHRIGDGDGIWNKGQPLVGDFNADGRDDLAFAFYSSDLGLRVRTKFSNGDGTWNHAEHVLGDGDGIWNKGQPLVGDFNVDGRDDLAFAFYSSDLGLRVRTKFSNGDGTWNHAEHVLGDGDGIWNKGQPLVGDFNADGRDDLAFAFYSPDLGLRIRTKFSNGNGTWNQAEHVLGDGDGIWNKGQPLVGDFNADGRDDLAFAFYSPDLGLRIRTKFSNGDGTWSQAEHVLGDGDGIWNKGQPLVGDFNADGRDDLAFAFYSPDLGLRIRTKFSNGNGTWNQAEHVLGDGDGIWNSGGPVASDFNGDGRTDLVFPLRAYGQVLLRTKRSLGNGQYASSQTSL
ncbi:MAG: VCBS repeat-containing protein [Polyangiaceae bacterium]|nr:VCBS repeat-containing protein [Polyangiaceae bacterium]